MATNDLAGGQGKEKIKELAEGIDFALMGTKLTEQPIHVIPMSTKKVDEDGVIWFLSGRDSEQNRNINDEGLVQLFYAKPGAMEFLTVYGKADVRTEHHILKELYGQSDDAWFEGIDDPNLSAIRVVPDEVRYWDTKSNKFVSLLKFGIGAMTGNQPDLGEEGDIHI